MRHCESIALWAAVVFLFGEATAAPAENRPAPEPRRIISLAPSLTETLFAVGAGAQVVGRTEFCNFPSAAKRAAVIGGYYDPNYEAILALRPDLVVLLPENQEHRARLQGLGIPTLTVEQHSLAGVINSCLQLGAVSGHAAEGARLADDFRAALARAHALTDRLPRQRVLLVMGRDYDGGRIRDVYCAGRGWIYDQVLAAAGGSNAYPSALPSYPKLSAEGVLALNPDVILELAPDAVAANKPPAALRQDWLRLPGLHPQRVVVLAGDYLTIPGPRLLQTLRTFGAALHPELTW
jgi:iron complex transport system substrate-binding protein